ncbi:unnamed protein product [Parnassius apollo]|uniref:(apollo) hypothetical protein n=1 Tax=Parnassius apollo TaxID=110799 RepID=A0A8S3VYR9_PARAO|nr:unnamed protein product [Parnassius apollo]
MKYFICILLVALIAAASAGYIGSGWSAPSYGYSVPIVYSRGWGSPYYSNGYSGYSGWGNNGWGNNAWGNNGWGNNGWGYSSW